VCHTRRDQQVRKSFESEFIKQYTIDSMTDHVIMNTGKKPMNKTNFLKFWLTINKFWTAAQVDIFE
jgi:hypothetical protein